MPMIDILAPAEQEGTKAVIGSWLRQVGDAVATNDPLVELETDKVTQEVSAPGAGVLAEIAIPSGGEVLPGALLGRLRVMTAAMPDAPAPEIAEAAPPSKPAHTGLSPSVRRAVREHEIDPASIAGTGRGGRLTRADVDEAVAARGSVAASPAPVARTVELLAPVLPPTALPATQPSGGRSVPHDRMRLAIAQNMLNSVTVAPHVTAVFEADFTAIMTHRRRHKAAFERDGANLTFTAYLVAASVAAMRAAPLINSRWYDDRLEIFDDINIGVGTALGDKGLIVPVIQRAQDLSLLGIATRLGDLTGRARTGKLSAAEVRGGTFTISNHGVSGSLLATPIIISQPQSAIVGVGKLEKRVVVREVDGIDTIQIRSMCYVSLTIDHRVVDGHQTNAWLSSFVAMLEGWPQD